MSEATIVWATDVDTGSAKHILEVETGLACNCLCTGCNAKLEAINSRNPDPKRRPHFRHHDTPELADCTQHAVLAGARESLRGATEIELPGMKVRHSARARDGAEFTGEVDEPPRRVQIESIEFVDATDAILTLEDGQRIYVRLIATGKRPVDPKQSLYSEILIDITDPVLLTADPATMRRHITLAPNSRVWCVYFRQAQLAEVVKAEAEKQADEHWRKREAQRQADDEWKQRQIQLNNSVVSAQVAADHDVHLPRSEQARSAPRIRARQPPAIAKVVWTDVIPDLASLKASAPTWEIILGGGWRDILTQGLTARDSGESVSEAIRRAAERAHVHPSTITGFWHGAGIVSSQLAQS
jgi:hypothetical protein